MVPQYLSLNFGQLLLLDDHIQGKEEQNETVASIAEHDGEQEREAGASVKARIDFTVGRHSVRVNQSLISLGKLIGSMERRRRLRRRHFVHDRRRRRTLNRFLKFTTKITIIITNQLESLKMQ